MQGKARLFYRYVPLLTGITLFTSAWSMQSVGQQRERMPTVIVTPVYPELARRAAVLGEVKCRILVDENGKVEKFIEVIGHSLLRDAASRVLSEWSFSPGAKGETTIQFYFHLIAPPRECSYPQARIELPNKVHIYVNSMPIQTSF